MNVSRIQCGIAAIVILVGCQDRGSFKSRTYTDAERVRFCKSVETKREAYPQPLVQACSDLMVKLGQGKPAPAETPVVDQGLQQTEPGGGDAPTGEATPSGGGGTPIVVPGGPKSTSNGKEEKNGPGQTEAKVNSEKAAAKKFFEPIDNRDKYIQSVTQLLDQSDSAFAASVVKGANITVESVSKTLAISIDAVIIFEGKARYLMLPWEPIVYVKNGRVTPLAPSLKEFDGSKDISDQLQEKVVLEAVCAEEDCKNIYVRLQIAVDGKIAIAVALVSAKDGSKHAIVRNNFSRKSFEDGVKDSYRSTEVDLSKLKGSKGKLPTTIENDEQQETPKPETKPKPETEAPKPKPEQKPKPETEALKPKPDNGDDAAARQAQADKALNEANQDIITQLMKQAPGGMKEVQGLTAKAIKDAASVGAGADAPKVQTSTNYSDEDYRPVTKPAVPETQKAEVKPDDRNAKALDALKKESVESHYMPPAQTEPKKYNNKEVLDYAELDYMPPREEAVVQTTSAPAAPARDESRETYEGLDRHKETVWGNIEAAVDQWFN